MAETKWTKDQQQVIDIRDNNVLVSAAAGSGKTAVLVERIISIVTGEGGREPVDVDKLLVVTFTRAAAGEMRERVLKALEKKALENPMDEHIRKQMTYIHNAKITTIDSFCADVVREHFSEIDLDPAFKVGDVGELTLLKSDVLSMVLEENYSKGEEAFLRFVDVYSGSKSDSQIEEIILKLYDFSNSYPNPVRWLDSLVDMYKEEKAHSWLNLVLSEVRKQLKDIYGSLEEALLISDKHMFDGIYKLINEEREYMKKLMDCDDFEDMGRQIKAFSFGRMPTLRGLSEKDDLAKKQVQNIRDGYKKVIKNLAAKYFSRSVSELIQDVTECRDMIETIVDLVKQFSVEYKNAKNDKDLVDFSDLEHFALDILVREDENFDYYKSETAIAMSEDIYEVMIDEYQDSNLVQEIILNAVSGRGKDSPNVFMVGDVKQSIYKFRLARPELFLEKYNTYEDIDGKGNSKKIVLSRNFRSRHQVLDFCNMIFKRLMVEELGGITYNEENMLYPGFGYETLEESDYKTEILFVDTGEDLEEKDGEMLTNIELEAALTADRINELVLGNGKARPLKIFDKDKKEYRDVKYSDIAILFRSTTKYVEVYTEILMSKGIPVCTSLSEGYFDTFEIVAILDLLSVIDNPRQDIKLAGVLRNVFGFSENMLADIRISGTGSFYNAFFQYEGIYDRQVSYVRERIKAYRKMVSYTSIYDLIYYIVEDTHFRQFILSGKAGEKRIANVEMLLEKAKAYESGPYSGLFNFVRYIEKLKKYKVEQGEASVIDENDNSVKIMTIHKSKGLEYPVVFVGGMGKRMNMRDSVEKLVIHHTLGIGIDRVDVEKRIRYRTLIKEAIGASIRHENLAEELRVLYVALTRAREKLILVGTGNVASKLEQGSGINSYMDWIIMSTKENTDNSLYSFKCISPSSIVYNRMGQIVFDNQMKKALQSFDTKKIYNGDIRNELRDVFSYTYKYKEDCQIRSKMSISDIKHMFMKMSADDENDGVELDFTEKHEKTDIDSKQGAMRGTAYHRVFELLDYDMELESLEDIKVMIKGMVEKGFIEKEAAELVNPCKIKTFVDSNLYARMKDAHSKGQLYREKPFVMGIPACEIDSDKYKSSELVVVQGIVDAWFVENGEVCVVDYKTDSVDKLEDLSARYKSQLDYYGEALSKITGKPVKDKIIYSVKFDDTLKII